ncbi:aromatic amino acid ammonia-lyase [Glaciihabitans sp. dw_435]|uniref:aromatic amino acid ammonia-lyase n=1 Tax=Glaciihabitans sp. dw_435 TaxID=2720081 RepID=UPI001BD2F7D7|nr:aromatic amino acid ammonia-lyase [Glaciihabitans sp. dw_435]
MSVLSRAFVEIADVTAVARSEQRVSFARVVELDLAASRAVVDAVLAEGKPVYGLNTELGAGRDIVVSNDRIEEFQRRTIRNSSGGLGVPLSREQARAVMFARLVGFTRGGAGVTPALAAQYLQLLNRDVVPLVPRTGSVGAADLTALAAIAAVATGTGQALLNGETVSGADALAAAGLSPVTLQAHEGLAVMSSNAYSVGVGALVIADLRVILRSADDVLSLSLTALAGHSTGGNPSPFSEEVQAAHRAPGQAASAARVRALLGEGRTASTQDPISFRSAPQVHGAARDAIEQTASLVTLELNSRTENPLVDVESGRMISGGNFQVVGLALGFETLRIALGHVAVTSERRLARLSGLAADLRRSARATVPGLIWYSAAAMVAEIRHLANPVSLAGTSLSEDVEDHSSNAALALQLLERSAALTRTVLAVEAIAAVELVMLADDPFVASAALQPLVDLLAPLVARAGGAGAGAGTGAGADAGGGAGAGTLSAQELVDAVERILFPSAS